jgi:hypothetical protein
VEDGRPREPALSNVSVLTSLAGDATVELGSTAQPGASGPTWFVVEKKSLCNDCTSAISSSWPFLTASTTWTEEPSLA